MTYLINITIRFGKFGMGLITGLPTSLGSVADALYLQGEDGNFIVTESSKFIIIKN